MSDPGLTQIMCLVHLHTWCEQSCMRGDQNTDYFKFGSQMRIGLLLMDLDFQSKVVSYILKFYSHNIR